MLFLDFHGPGANEIKRHPEAETLLVTGDNRTEVIQKLLAPSSLRGVLATKQSPFPRQESMADWYGIP